MKTSDYTIYSIIVVHYGFCNRGWIPLESTDL